MLKYKKSITAGNASNIKLNLKITSFGQQNIIEVKEIIEQIDALPAAHLQNLNEITYDPQRLIPQYINDPLAELNTGAKGVFIQSHRLIAIFQIDSVEQFYHVLFHELGHHVYFLVIGQQLKKKWVTEVCRKDKFVTRYAARNAAEDFAECYVTYLRNPDKLKKIPLKFNFMKEFVFSTQSQNNSLDVRF